ncbi:hypothetical protein D3C74_389450 [compost metagenome]
MKLFKEKFSTKINILVTDNGNLVQISLYPNDRLLGLIPTMIDRISLDKERKLIEHAYDLTDQVKWNQIGIDTNNPGELIEINRFLDNGVEWLDKVPVMVFSKEDYKSIEKIYKYKER